MDQAINNRPKRRRRRRRRRSDANKTYDVICDKTWDEVTEAFNRTMGTSFTRRRIMQIGEKARKKIADALIAQGVGPVDLNQG